MSALPDRSFRPVIAVLLAHVLLATPAQAEPVADRLAEQFADSTAARSFLDVSPDTDVLRYVQKRQQTGGKPTMTYRGFSERYMTESFYQNGCGAYYRANHEAFKQTHERYGVGPSIILSIWGLETRFGAIQPEFEARRALLALAGSRYRSAFFRRQLTALTHAYLQGYLPESSVPSSWAGAMGQPQFIPTSYLHYARDGDGDEVRDIWTNPADVIASIGYYLKRRGWSEGRPVITKSSTDYARTVTADSATFRVTTNYTAVTEYNPSRYYALTAGQLMNTFRARCITSDS